MEQQEFDKAIAELVFDGFSPEEIGEMARKSAEKAEHELREMLSPYFKAKED